MEMALDAVSPVQQHGQTFEQIQSQSVFGPLGQGSTETKDEEGRIIQHVNNPYDEQAEDYMLQQRLNTLLQTVEWWEMLGCPLCFAETGTMEPDHDLTTCEGVHAGRARQILSWLHRLDIPRRWDSKLGSCVICAGICAGMWAGVRPCQEVNLGEMISDAKNVETRSRIIEEYIRKAGKGSQCQRKSLMYGVIAALCACKNQLFCGILVRLALDRDGKDLRSDEQARFWFRQRIPLEGYWFPGMILAYERLVISFYIHQNSQRGWDALYGFPRRPAGHGSLPSKVSERIPYDDMDELIHWKDCLEWWLGRCSFCAGRGLPAGLTMHNVRQCRRRPTRLFNEGLGEAFYDCTILPRSGCNKCGVPYAFCDSWRRDDDGGGWVLADINGQRCQYRPYYVSDILLGLYYCGRSKFVDTVVDYEENWEYFWDGVNDEKLAQILARSICIEGIDSSKMMRVMGLLTWQVWKVTGKGV